MAEYSLTPYLFSVAKKYKPEDSRKMVNLSESPDLTATEFMTNCFLSLVEEENPREFGVADSRLLEGVDVLAYEDQVLFKMRVGVTGFTSSLDLSSIGASAPRKHSDPEWFNLRAMFVNVPGSRKGLLLIERVANYSAYSVLSDTLKSAARLNLQDTIIKFEPIQDLKAVGQDLSDMLTKAIEFRTMIKPERSDVADRAAGEDTIQPFEKVARPSMKRYTKFTQRGGLGTFGRFRGKTVEQLSQQFGYVPDPGESTEVVATVEDQAGKPRTISIQNEEAASVSFAIERENQDSEPTDEEFLNTVEEVVGVLSTYINMTSDKLVRLSEFESADEFLGVEEWRLNE